MATGKTTAPSGPTNRLYLTREQLLRRQFLGDLLRARALGGLAAAAALLVFQYSAPESNLWPAVGIAFLVPASSLLVLLWVRTHGSDVVLGGHLALISDLILITCATLALGGVDSGVPALYLWILVASGLFFRSSAVPRYTLACGLAAALLFGLQVADRYAFMPTPPGRVAIGLKATVLVLSTLMAAFGTYLLVRAQERVVAEVEQLNDALERRIGEATLDLAEALRETKELHNGLNASYEKLNRLQRFRDDMIHMIVHDLKSPLSNISTTLAIMESVLAAEGLADTDEQQLLQNAGLSAEQMGRLIANLLDIHRLEEGKLQVELAETDLSATLRERCAQIGGRLAQKQLALTARIPDRLPARADQVLFGRVVDNLLDNAIKYTPTGGHIAVTCDPRPGQVVVCVADSGPGIPESDRERVFDKFEQLSGARYSDFGVGLGLAFCKMAVQAQGGRIWVEPEGTSGAMFCVALAQAGEPELTRI